MAPYCERLSMDYPVSAAVQCDTIICTNIRSYEEKLATDRPKVGQAGAGETLDSNYLIIDGQPFFRTGSKWVQDHITP